MSDITWLHRLYIVSCGGGIVGFSNDTTSTVHRYITSRISLVISVAVFLCVTYQYGRTVLVLFSYVNYSLIDCNISNILSVVCPLLTCLLCRYNCYIFMQVIPFGKYSYLLDYFNDNSLAVHPSDSIKFNYKFSRATGG